jgi:hypothetical protein
MYCDVPGRYLRLLLVRTSRGDQSVEAAVAPGFRFCANVKLLLSVWRLVRLCGEDPRIWKANDLTSTAGATAQHLGLDQRSRPTSSGRHCAVAVNIISVTGH